VFEIIVLKNGVEQGRFPLNVPISTIGRADNNQIVLAEDSVSRRHARFLLEGAKIYIEDLHSGNGTFLGNQRLQNRQEIQGGDEVQIAPFTLKVNLPAAQEKTAPQDLRTVMIPGLMQHQMQQGPIEPAKTGARLILRRGEAGKSSYVMSTQPITIGRSEDRDVILTDPASSRRHATIHFMGDHYLVKDEGSANGVMMNGVSVRESTLNAGDRLVIGETEFEFVWPGAPQKIDPSQFPAEGATLHQPPTPAALNGGHDPYSETGIMPAYGNWPGQPGGGQEMGGYSAAGAYGQPGAYGTEMGGAPVKNRKPLRLVMVAVLVLVGAAIGIKTVSTRSQPTDAVVVGLSTDPCAGVGETCPDSTDQNCLNCLNKRARLARGQELFGQKEFESAIAEFQRILADIDPLDHKAARFRYISYEYQVLTGMEDTLRDRSQTTAQKLQRMKEDFSKAQDLAERYLRASYTKDTPEATVATARARLSEAVSLLNAVTKTKSDDPGAGKLRSDAESLRGRAVYQISRLGKLKEVSAQETFTQSVQQLFEEAQALKSGGNMARAQTKFREVMDKDPQHKTPYYEQAKQELEAINHSLKDRAKPLLNEAIAKIKNEQWVEARSKLQEALKIDPNLDEARAKLAEVNEECLKRAKKLYSEAKVQYNVSQYSQAEKLLRQVIAFVPDKEDDINQKAVRMLQDMGKN